MYYTFTFNNVMKSHCLCHTSFSEGCCTSLVLFPCFQTGIERSEAYCLKSVRLSACHSVCLSSSYLGCTFTRMTPKGTWCFTNIHISIDFNGENYVTLQNTCFFSLERFRQFQILRFWFPYKHIKSRTIYIPVSNYTDFERF